MWILLNSMDSVLVLFISDSLSGKNLCLIDKVSSNTYMWGLTTVVIWISLVCWPIYCAFIGENKPNFFPIFDVISYISSRPEWDKFKFNWLVFIPSFDVDVDLLKIYLDNHLYIHTCGEPLKQVILGYFKFKRKKYELEYFL